MPCVLSGNSAHFVDNVIFIFRSSLAPASAHPIAGRTVAQAASQPPVSVTVTAVPIFVTPLAVCFHCLVISPLRILPEVSLPPPGKKVSLFFLHGLFSFD